MGDFFDSLLSCTATIAPGARIEAAGRGMAERAAQRCTRMLRKQSIHTVHGFPEFLLRGAECEKRWLRPPEGVCGRLHVLQGIPRAVHVELAVELYSEYGFMYVKEYGRRSC